MLHRPMGAYGRMKIYLKSYLKICLKKKKTPTTNVPYSIVVCGYSAFEGI